MQIILQRAFNTLWGEKRKTLRSDKLAVQINVIIWIGSPRDFSTNNVADWAAPLAEFILTVLQIGAGAP